MNISIENPLPPDEIVVRGGAVVKLTCWCNWNGRHEIVEESRREPDGRYMVHVMDPEHGGGGPVYGATMAEAARQVLHPDIVAERVILFGIRNPTEEHIRALHYRTGDGLRVTFYR